MTWITALLLSVTLAAPFGAAEARATDVGDGGMTLEVRVEVNAPATAVLVRGVDPSGQNELPPVALSDLGDGTWGGIVELPVVENIRLGFELIPASGPATVSELRTLVELGVDAPIFHLDEPATSTAASEEPASHRSPVWVLLALVAGFGALGLVALWTWWGRGSREDDAEEAEDLASGDLTS
jgi:hypothetical protein